MGGVNYVLNWARALYALPAAERPHLTLLTATPAAQEIAEAHRDLADAIAPFQDTAKLDLDFVFPATQLAEAPFGAPWAGWVPDWQCRHMPELFSEGERTRRFLQYRVLARSAPICVLSSQMALEDTQRLFPDDHAPFRVLHFPAVFADEVYARAPERLAATRARLNVPDRYVLVMNQFWRHKNHLVALEALRRAVHPDTHLVMSGVVSDERWPEYETKIRALLAAPDIARRATLLGPVARDDQIDLMLGAVGVLQPSRFEGWSTVVEEARALGLPALLSEFPVHREQNPPGAVFFDPEDSDALAALLDRWFATAPVRLPLNEARDRQRAYVADCARRFLAIAAEAKAAYTADRHELAPIASAGLVEVRTDRDAGRLTVDDENLYQANIRGLFRDYPEELARLAALVCDETYPLYPGSMDSMITSALAKMSPAARQRFLNADLDAAGYDRARQALASPTGRLSLSALATVARVRDHVRRKLKL